MAKDDAEKPIRALLRHVRNVQDECCLLAERLLEQGKTHLAKSLIANGMLHDNSKFRGVEWDYLGNFLEQEHPERLSEAVSQHQLTNPHHPEYWDGIDNMPDVYLAEMVCDWKARSDEFGTDLREWVKEKATKRWGFSSSGRVYKRLKDYMDLLLDARFS